MTVGLACSVCHELRNPLHAVMATLAHLTDDGTLSDDHRLDVKVLSACASQMQRLVNDVLDMAKLKTRTLKIVKEQVGV